MTLQQVLVLAGPLLYAPIGTSLGSFLAQDNFPKAVNSLIAWLVVILCACASAYSVHGLVLSSVGLEAFVQLAYGAGTLLLAGGLQQLRPWLAWQNLLAGFSFVPKTIDPQVTAKRPAIAPNVPPRANAPKAITIGVPPTNNTQHGG